MNKKELREFIQKVLETKYFEGCWYNELGHNLFLVFSKNENNDLDCKVAYNSDDLQCDYDFDWFIPTNKKRETIGDDWTDILECGYTVDELTNEVVESYKYIINCGWRLKNE